MNIILGVRSCLQRRGSIAEEVLVINIGSSGWIISYSNHWAGGRNPHRLGWGDMAWPASAMVLRDRISRVTVDG